MALSAVDKVRLTKQPHNPLGDAVCAYAKEKLAAQETLGNGECTEFVQAALAAAGANPGDTSDPKMYKWGKEVFQCEYKAGLLTPDELQFGQWQCGDIIQFWDAKFEWVEGGSLRVWQVSNPGSADDAERRHTAIILSPPGLYASATSWRTLLAHQNDSNLRYVTERWIPFHNLVNIENSQFYVYRPI